MDALQRYGVKVRKLDSAIDAATAARAQAEGVRSALGGDGGGSGSAEDATAERYAALIEDIERLKAEYDAADDLRQTLVECIAFVPDERQQLVLMAALCDVQRNGRVSAARMARRLGVSERTARREYDAALVALEAVMREHRAL